MKLIDLATLLLLAAIWGASFLFIRVASPVLGPAVLTDVRVLLAGGVLLVYALVGRIHLDVRRWREFLLLGAVNAALPFMLIAAAELALTASFAAILNATTPLFTAAVAALWLKQPLSSRAASGLALGFAGVVVAVGWSPIPLSLHLFLAITASLGGALCYGIGFVYISRSFRGEPALSLGILQQMAAGLFLLPATLVKLPSAMPSISVVFSVLGLALLGTTFAYFLYFRLIRRVGPTSAATVTFLVPVFGLFWSLVFLREPVGPGLLAGLVLILVSVGLVTGLRVRPFPRRSTDLGLSRLE